VLVDPFASLDAITVWLADSIIALPLGFGSPRTNEASPQNCKIKTVFQNATLGTNSRVRGIAEPSHESTRRRKSKMESFAFIQLMIGRVLSKICDQKANCEVVINRLTVDLPQTGFPGNAKISQNVF
jgi:hypothetical protein